MPSLARPLPLIAAAGVLVLTGLTTAGCARIREHQGYIGEQVLIDSVQPGVDNRESVQAILGQPSFVSQFTEPGETPVWYYVTRDTRQLAFANPKPVEQDTLAIHFNERGTVTSVGNVGLDQVASIDPYGRETPTLGRSRGFFKELFGNIGAAGRAGQAGDTADNPGGD